MARAALEDTEKKLKRAGADRVISPYKASGTEMARLALHRQLSGVVDVDAQYRMEDIVVGESCEALGRTVGDIRGGSMIVGLRRGAEFQPQPPAETTLLAGDTIVAIGTPPRARSPRGAAGGAGRLTAWSRDNVKTSGFLGRPSASWTPVSRGFRSG